ncbi:hypothetical protein MO867_06120 [Microbulbifer sp. OS29]|uniref:Lipoprotein n=1 Tax=Microbulbifer okhotskensis TaxID=2926617 RepID=A0A9X2J4B4_9GAMM|nr:hypothetical protein [Microbulbifer okhotskensis]MCO1333913.1 hypothetical protein [Microbulbifer okhotskensis]
MLKKRLFCLLWALILIVTVAACGQSREEPAVKNEVENIPGAVGPEATATPPPPPGEMVWVYRSSGSKQCEGGGMTLPQSLAKLRGSGVAVQESRCGVRTDRMFASVCGAPTGDILMHLVGMDALDAALELGYNPAEKVQYQFSACRDNSA